MIKYKVSDVYGVNRDIPLNYITRRDVDEKFKSNLDRGKHIIIYGSSKQGKTSLRKKYLDDNKYIVIHCSNKWGIGDLHSAILKQAGYQVTLSDSRSSSGKQNLSLSVGAGFFSASGSAGRDAGSSVTVKPLDIDQDDVNDVIGALNGFNKFIVLEDFHYLPQETQKSFSVSLKAFHERSRISFIIVGVWLEEGRLTVYNGDLTGRVVGINADKWDPEELRQVVSSGERLLNISFSDSFKNEIIEKSLDSVYIVQECCFSACEREGISETFDVTRERVGASLSASELIREAVNHQRARYNSFISLFSSGFQETSLQMYKWILYPVLTSSIEDLEQGLSYRRIRESINGRHPEGKALNPGNITQALQSTASLQVKKEIKPIVLDYDQTNMKLNVVDRGFLIWLNNQDRNDLLDLAGIPTG